MLRQGLAADPKRPPMPPDLMKLCDRVGKAADADRLRGMIGIAAGRLTEPKVGAAAGAAQPASREGAEDARRTG